MKKAALPISALFVFIFLFAVRANPPESLFPLAANQILDRRFPDENLSYLLVEIDAETKNVVSSRWAESGRPLPMGSLVKPFTALAFAGSHGLRYPEYVCRGKDGQCWYPPGHGRMDIANAVAYSCNAYFRSLASGLRRDEVQTVLDRFGINSLPTEITAATLIGLDKNWKVSPLAMVQAYLELAARAAEPGATELIRGMALSARMGTGKGVKLGIGGTLPGSIPSGRLPSLAPLLAKTGTGPCTHGVEWSGDGYVLALYPMDAPRLALLVQVHGTSGAEAAKLGGRMLSALINGD